MVIKGANVMRGYLNRPEETAKTVVDGWLHTGDIGHLDEDGYLVLVDRAKDMIIRGGENIYPREIEAVVHQLPQIAEAAVVGRPDPTYGEVPVLYVSPTPARRSLSETIRDHIAEHLAKYKRPADITILDDLPKNAVGKIKQTRSASATGRLARKPHRLTGADHEFHQAGVSPGRSGHLLGQAADGTDALPCAALDR